MLNVRGGGGVYFLAEVIPWFFSVCASFSRTGDSLPELDYYMIRP